MKKNENKNNGIKLKKTYYSIHFLKELYLRNFMNMFCHATQDLCMKNNEN